MVLNLSCINVPPYWKVRAIFFLHLTYQFSTFEATQPVEWNYVGNSFGEELCFVGKLANQSEGGERDTPRQET